jgi:hypothetical protein
MNYNYILVISPEYAYNADKLVEKLNIAINWLQVVPNVYILKSSSDLNKWYLRLKSVLRDNMFYMVKINLSTEEYTGWLEQHKWDWIRKNTVQT